MLRSSAVEVALKMAMRAFSAAHALGADHGVRPGGGGHCEWLPRGHAGLHGRCCAQRPTMGVRQTPWCGSFMAALLCILEMVLSSNLSWYFHSARVSMDFTLSCPTLELRVPPDALTATSCHCGLIMKACEKGV